MSFLKIVTVISFSIGTLLAASSFSYAQVGGTGGPSNNTGTPRETLTRIEVVQYQVSMKSDENGVCKYFGYEKALHKSMQGSTFPSDDGYIFDVILPKTKPTKFNALRIGADGVPLEMKYSQIIGYISCIKIN